MTRTLVSARVIIQIQLMVLLSVPPLPCGQNLRDNATLPPLLVYLLCDFSRLLLLFFIVVEDCRSILRSSVRTLSVRGGGVMHFVEEFDEGAIFDLFRVVDDLESLGVCKSTCQ